MSLRNALDTIGGPRTLLIGSLIGLAGAALFQSAALLAVAVFFFVLFILFGRMPEQLDVHGSAQWASLAEVKAWTKGNEGKRGARIDLGMATEGRRSIPLAWKTDKHVLIVASARSGKGTDLIIPNLLAYDG